MSNSERFVIETVVTVYDQIGPVGMGLPSDWTVYREGTRLSGEGRQGADAEKAKHGSHD